MKSVSTLDADFFHNCLHIPSIFHVSLIMFYFWSVDKTVEEKSQGSQPNQVQKGMLSLYLVNGFLVILLVQWWRLSWVTHVTMVPLQELELRRDALGTPLVWPRSESRVQSRTGDVAIRKL